MNPGGKKIGLALGGGIARGLAHLGVLLALEEAGIRPDLVAGSSAGALAGALYLSGLPLDQVERLAYSLGWLDLARPTWPSRGFVSFAPLRRWFTRAVGDLAFEDLVRPLAVALTDLETGRPVYLQHGRLAPAVCASCVIPGIVAPDRVDGRLLGDGTLVDAIPVEILRRMGADYVIGVDLFQPRLQAKRRLPGWGLVGSGLNALEITFRRAGGGLQQADCLITPQLAGETYINFGRARRLAELGRAAALEKIPEILSTVSQAVPLVMPEISLSV